MNLSVLDPSIIRREVLQGNNIAQLEEIGVILQDDHFDYGNGFHGSCFVNPHEILRFPYRLWQLAQNLIELIDASVLHQLEVVVGPVTGGAMLAHVMAGLIDGKRDFKELRVQFARLDRIVGNGDKYQLNAFYAAIVAGRQVLLVDDVLNTGGTLEQCGELIQIAGGQVLAIAVLFDRMEAIRILPKTPMPMARWKAPTNYPADKCPLCKARVPIRQIKAAEQ